MGHVALTGVAVGVLTGAAPVLTALVAAVAGGGRRSSWSACPRAHERRRRARRDVLRRHRRRRRAHRQAAEGGTPGEPQRLPVRRDHHHDPRGPRRRSPGSRRSSSACTDGLAPRLFAVSNDEEYARASGLPVLGLNLLLAVLTAVTVVMSMRVVGLLLISALMIVPNATAQLLGRSFRATIALAVLVGVVVSVVGVPRRSTPTPLRAARSCCCAIAVFVAGGLGRTAAPPAARPAARTDGRAPATSTAPLRAPGGRRTTTTSTTCTTATGTPRTARTTTSTDASTDEHSQHDARAQEDRPHGRRPPAGPRAARRRARRSWPSRTTFRSAQELHAQPARARRPVGLATVYRDLQAMAEDGEIDVLRTDDGEAVYRRCCTGHHHHLVCRVCGRTVEVEDSRSSAGPRRWHRSTASPTSSTKSRCSAPAPPVTAPDRLSSAREISRDVASERLTRRCVRSRVAAATGRATRPVRSCPRRRRNGDLDPHSSAARPTGARRSTSGHRVSMKTSSA